MIGSISQHALHDRKLRFLDRRAAGWSLFPFFDDDGRTQAFLLIHGGDGRITLIDFQDQLFAGRALLPRLGSQRIHLDHAELPDSQDAENLASLWHFDPWWELGADRYQGHPAVPVLKATNLPGHDGSITRVWFDKTLSRVTWIGSGEGEALKVKRFEPSLLTPARRRRGREAALTPSPAGGTGWRLNPFWQRTTT